VLKIQDMKKLTFLLLLFLSAKLFSQTLIPNVEFVGNKILVLQAKKGAYAVTGKLSTGEVIKSGCDRNACFFRIEYKGRTIEKSVGSDFSKMIIYEFDFGGDGDNEIVVVNISPVAGSSKETCWLNIYRYSKGIIEKLFEKEIMDYRTVIKKTYIEFYMPGGLDSVWNYFQGQFWLMTPVDRDKFKIK
jgi:hypothetical protein